MYLYTDMEKRNFNHGIKKFKPKKKMRSLGQNT